MAELGTMILFLSLQQNFICAVPSSDFPVVSLSALKSPQKEMQKVFSSGQKLRAVGREVRLNFINFSRKRVEMHHSGKFCLHYKVKS